MNILKKLSIACLIVIFAISVSACKKDNARTSSASTPLPSYPATDVPNRTNPMGPGTSGAYPAYTPSEPLVKNSKDHNDKDAKGEVAWYNEDGGKIMIAAASVLGAGAIGGIIWGAVMSSKNAKKAKEIKAQEGEILGLNTLLGAEQIKSGELQDKVSDLEKEMKAKAEEIEKKLKELQACKEDCANGKKQLQGTIDQLQSALGLQAQEIKDDMDKYCANVNKFFSQNDKSCATNPDRCYENKYKTWSARLSDSTITGIYDNVDARKFITECMRSGSAAAGFTVKPTLNPVPAPASISQPATDQSTTNQTDAKATGIGTNAGFGAGETGAGNPVGAGEGKPDK